MKKSYIKPNMVTYDRAEIMELIGPVKTQYCGACSEVQAAPSSFLQGKVFDAGDPFTVSVNTGNCPQFQTVEITIPGSSPFIFYQFNRGQGSESGGSWSVDLDGFQFLGERGDYALEVTLIDGQGNAGGSCQTTITVE